MANNSAAFKNLSGLNKDLVQGLQSGRYYGQNTRDGGMAFYRPGGGVAKRLTAFELGRTPATGKPEPGYLVNNPSQQVDARRFGGLQRANPIEGGSSVISQLMGTGTPTGWKSSPSPAQIMQQALGGNFNPYQPQNNMNPSYRAEFPWHGNMAGMWETIMGKTDMQPQGLAPRGGIMPGVGALGAPGASNIPGLRSQVGAQPISQSGGFLGGMGGLGSTLMNALSTMGQNLLHPKDNWNMSPSQSWNNVKSMFGGGNTGSLSTGNLGNDNTSGELDYGY
jgi:hypothetical protein